ncbi:cadmium/zinc-transporting ATPase HMA3-like isoform X2 [Phragmites australis]|uniref:cadmium/zinc-transporting ATPase HMA3-like isoform X2 n=1 Tax=Phragmites australis TaxID=29695 RepID=UPI002D78CB54|nr:cadmium/zinc-transporting ATPase HMA3-like isoform X2 [Phragmites australis]
MDAGERRAETPEAAALKERLLAAARNGDDNGGGSRKRGKWEKTYLDVLGVCCSAEVALVERLLAPIDGVRAVNVVVASRTVIVEHDPAVVSQSHIVKALNKAGLEASVRAYGTSGVVGRWPSPYIISSGALLLASFFAWLLPPLRWLALAAACAGAPPMMLRAFAASTRLSLDINVMMLVAVAGAVALGDYTEAGVIVFLFTTAEWLETLACTKASAGMSSLMSMIPPKVVLAETGEVVSVRDVTVGAVVAVRAGEVVPIDGVVVDGQSEVDESSLTGESFPVPKQPQSEVWAGTLNLDGYIAVRTTALAENSTVAKMERLVEEAQNSRSETQRLIDSCAKYYTPAVVFLAASVALVPLMLGAQDLGRWFQLALVLLVSACPCALVLSTPVATFCALLRAARMGVLIKGGDILESLGAIRIAAFDKTGTITKGEFSINGFHVVGDKVEMSQLLYWVSSIESKSSHPMAAALVEYSQSKFIGPKPEMVTEFRIFPGEGIYGEINGTHIYIGNGRIMTRSSCHSHTVPEIDDHNGASIGYVICNSDLVGVFSLSDDCRTGAAEAIQELRSMGIKSVLLSGDSRAAAMHAQEQLGGALEELHSELLPEDKVRLVRGLKARAGPTLMVGDGMNDAPALAMADVGVSMGLSGSAAAMETSHATLMSSNILRVPEAVRLGRRARRTIAINVVVSIGAKVAVLALAVAWRPVLWAAVLADVGTCLLVVLHSMLLLRAASGRQRGSGYQACRATVRSLAMRSQLAGGSDATAARSVQGPREEPYHCCQKKSKSPEHSVVIDIPAPAAKYQEEANPRAGAKGKIPGCCGAGKACNASAAPLPSATRAPPECRADEEDREEGEDSRMSVKTACCNKGRGSRSPIST